MALTRCTDEMNRIFYILSFFPSFFLFMIYNIIKEAGPQCLATQQSFKSLIHSLHKDESDIAHALIYMARTSSIEGDELASSYTWNIDTFLSLDVDWNKVASRFDQPDFYVGDMRAFGVVMRISPSIGVFLSRWNNTRGQMSYLGMFLLRSGMRFGANVLSQDSLSQTPQSTRVVAIQWIQSSWNSMDIIQCIVDASEYSDDARQLLERGVREQVELVAIALSRFRRGLYAESVYRRLFKVFLQGHSSSVFVLQRIYAVDDMTVECMSELYERDAKVASRLLDVIQEQKQINSTIDKIMGKNAKLAIDLALLASKREYLNIEKYLNERMTPQIYSSIIDYQLNSPQPILLRILQLHKYPQFSDKLKQLTPFTKQQEDECNHLYELYYKDNISINDLLAKLHSNIIRCFINILFEEYKVFNQYPDRELVKTALLLGQLIQRDLMNQRELAIGLKIVLESLRRGAETKMFKFGLRALEEFKSRLREWPQYSGHLMQINHLMREYPMLMQSMSSQGVAAKGAVSAISNTSSITTSSTLDTDKILFILNNLTSTNIAEKARELRTILTSQPQLEAFCSYLITKRIALEPNNHEMYNQLLSSISPSINDILINTTIINIKLLLDKKEITSQERSILKNYGSYLGSITLHKNKPIKDKALRLKLLLIEAYLQNKLIVIIPFICKLLEQCQDSKVFHPPNPWMMGLLQLLVELYYYADLKLNLKFEIEVLFRNIKVDLKSVEASQVLRQQIQSNGDLMEMIRDYIQRVVGVPDIATLLFKAVDKSIKEIIQPVVERSLSIASITTKELVQKDFCLDPNDSLMHQSASGMLQQLSGSLAMVTCREPFRQNLVQNIPEMEQQLLMQEVDGLPLVQVLTDLSCLYVERACFEKARKVELQLRRQQLDLSKLPPELTAVNYQVYEEYSKWVTGRLQQGGLDKVIAQPSSQLDAVLTLLKSIPHDNTEMSQETIQTVRQLNALIQQLRDEHMFELLSILLRGELSEVHCLLIERILEINKRIGREFVMYLLYNYLAVPIDKIVALVRNGGGIVDLNELDVIISKEFESNRLEGLERRIEFVDGIVAEFGRLSMLRSLRAMGRVVEVDVAPVDETSLEYLKFSLERFIKEYYQIKLLPGGCNLLEFYQKLDLFCERLQFDSRQILTVLTLVITNDHENMRELFDGRIYFRIIVNLINSTSEYFTIALFLNNLRPQLLPSFVFCYLQLISHRKLVLNLLDEKQKNGWEVMSVLLLNVFKFMAPFLRHAELLDPIKLLYKGLLRVLLVFLHDYPEFLCEYHFIFCDYIPPSCIQLRNLVLSAFPRNMRLPDPFTRDLKVDLLPETQKVPQISGDYIYQLHGIIDKLDDFLATNKDILPDLLAFFKVNETDVYLLGSHYNVHRMNAFVLYMSQKRSAMDLMVRVMNELDAEGRYHLLNGIANHLRYPNSHTHYFSCVLLYLFAECVEGIKEQITRVLLERLIVNRPHPWGLLITFIELLKNPRYGFWSYGFTRCAPDIERLFASVARSCMVPVVE